METTDRLAVRAIVAARRTDVAIAVEEQEVRVAIVRRSRPIGAAATDIAQTAIVAAAITRSRIPDGLVRAKLAGEIRAFVRIAVGVRKR